MNKRATENNLNREEFEQLKEAYVSTIVDSMSMKDLVQYVSNDMQDFLDKLSESDVINEIKSFSCRVDVVDPHADSDELQKEYGFELTTTINAPYDAIIVAVNHKDYLSLDEKYFKSILSEKGVLVDIKGIYMDTNFDLDYWTL